MDPVTKDDLDNKFKEFKTYFIEKLDDKLDPIIKLQGKHELSLHGRSGNNGLSGTVKVLLWGYGLLSLAVGKLFWK